MEQSFSAPSANPETEEDRGQVAPESKWHRRAANRPEELFQAALAVVLEKGYRATRLEDIAHHAGVTKPLIYHYFKDKDDLVFKSLEWKIGQILDDMRSESGPSEAGTNERLRKLFEYSWARWRRTEFGFFHGTILFEMRLENPELFRKWTEVSLVQRWKVVEDILRAGQLRGDVRNDLDAAAAARFLISGGIQLAWLHLHTAIPEFAPCREKTLRETALNIFLRGIEPDRTEPAANP